MRVCSSDTERRMHLEQVSVSYIPHRKVSDVMCCSIQLARQQLPHWHSNVVGKMQGSVQLCV